MLRPTESPTLFLQQLGRGLRKAKDKAFCTVLDFVGTHRKEFRFDRRYRALLGGTRRDVERAVQQQFPFLPAGCHMELDAEGRRDRAAQPARGDPVAVAGQGRRAAIASPGAAARSASPSTSTRSGLDLDDVYAGTKGWSDLLERTPVCRRCRPGRTEAVLRRAVGRLLHIDDDERTRHLPPTPRQDRPRPTSSTLPERDDGVCCTCSSPRSPTQALDKDATAPGGRRPAVGPPAGASPSCASCSTCSTAGSTTSTSRSRTHPDCPLQVHARYTRIEILAAFGLGAGRAKVAAWQSGVYEAKPANAELFAFTLDKSSGGLLTDHPLPRLRHQPHAHPLGEPVDHPRADSATGLRYRQPRARRPQRSCCSPAAGRRPRLLVPRPGHATAATSARSPWRSPGSSTIRSPATSSPVLRRGGRLTTGFVFRAVARGATLPT